MRTITIPDTEQRVAGKKTAPPAAVDFDLYSLLATPESFSTKWIVSGIILGFIVCCLGGRVISGINFYQNFHRFHNFINPTSSFYPTISQMVSLVEANTKPDQTIVIVGGNSIFYGFGQNGSELWSLALQEDLGDRFAVFNFAMPSSDPFEGAYWAAESLLKKKRHVIYVTVAHPATTGFPEGSDVYGYAYWDAHEKRLLFHDKDRDESISARLAGHSPEKRQKLIELRLRMMLDSVLYFEDLWTAIGYSRFFTVWTEPTAAHPFQPRNKFGEESYQTIPIEQRVRPEFVKALKPDYRTCFKPDSAIPIDSFWANMVGHASRLAPAMVKRNCLVMIPTPMPRYLSMLSEIDREREYTAIGASQKAWALAGFNSSNFRDHLNDADFADGVHLGPSGGKKVAALVAKDVQKIASHQ